MGFTLLGYFRFNFNYYSSIVGVVYLVIIVFGIIYNYIKIIYLVINRGAKISKQLLKLFIFPFILMITELPVFIYFSLIYTYNRVVVLIFITVIMLTLIHI